MTFVDRSLEFVRRAVQLVGKKPLAARAEVTDSLLRNVGHADYAPTARTLRKLEKASRDVLRENGVAVPEDIQ